MLFRHHLADFVKTFTATARNGGLGISREQIVDLSGYSDISHRFADAAGEKVLNFFRQELDIENKSDGSLFDPVTRADKEAESVIREMLKAECPDHGIVGEEFANIAGSSPYCWVIDPIDGTRAFVMGFPDWGILIGLLQDGIPVLGVMDQPFTKERFWTDGAISWYSGPGGKKELKVRNCPDLESALLSTTSPDFFQIGSELDSFMALKGQVRMTRYGGDCYSYCLLAAGMIDLVVEAGLKAYDIVALIPIIEKAGGIVTDWQGGPASNGGQIIAAGSKAVHEAAIKVLNDA